MLLLTGALAFTLLTGCGSSGSSYDSSYYDEGMMDSASAGKAASNAEMADVYDYDYEAAYEEAPAEAGSGNVETPDVKDSSRKLITTVNLSAETNDFDNCVNNLTSRVEALGGYIESSEIYNGSKYYYSNNYSSGSRTANFTIRIPADKLNEYLSLVNETTNIVNKSQSVQDVTLDYVDLESHKKALETEEERLLELLAQADNLEDMLTIESRLSDIRYQLESMESQLRTFDNKVDYSTVYLNLSEVIEYTPEPEDPPETFWERVTSGFIDDLNRVWGNLTDFAVWFISHIPTLVVWAIVIILAVIIVRKINNRGLSPEEIREKKEEKRRLKEQRKADKKRMKEMSKQSKDSDPQ